MSSHRKLRSGVLITACAVLFAVPAQFFVGSVAIASPIADGEEPPLPSDEPSTGDVPKLPNSPGGQYHGPLDGVPYKGGLGGGVRPPERTSPKPAVSKPKGEPGKGPTGGPAGLGARGTARGIEGFGGKRGARTNAEESWELWWEQNGYRYVEMRFETDEPLTQVEASMFLTGQGETPDRERARFSDELIRDRVLPAFEAVLKTRDLELLEASVIPYAQCVPFTDSSRAATALLPLLQVPSRSLQVKTLLALGLTRSRSVLPILVGILRDQKHGRTALGTSSSIADELRGAAAIALGYLRDPDSLRILEEVIFESKKSAIETRAMSVRALGEFPAQRDAATEILLEVVRDTRLDDEIRAQAPLALRRLGAQKALPALAKIAASDKTPARFAESCVIALGDLATPVDAAVITLLRDRAMKDANAQLRNFALIALGEIAERAIHAEPQAYRSFTAEIATFLVGEIRKPSRTGNAPWASLAAALAARSLQSFDPARADAIATITGAFAEEANADHRGALAVALALLGEHSQASTLRDELADIDDAEFAGHVSVALGMLDDRASLPQLEKLALRHGDPTIARQAARALALLGGSSLSSALTDALQNSRSLGQIRSLAHAVGLLGDRNSLETLARIATDENGSKALRAETCAALGLLGQRIGKSLRRDVIGVVNYRCEAKSLQQLLAIDA